MTVTEVCERRKYWVVGRHRNTPPHGACVPTSGQAGGQDARAGGGKPALVSWLPDACGLRGAGARVRELRFGSRLSPSLRPRTRNVRC